MPRKIRVIKTLLSNHQLISSTSITTSLSTLPILDQAPATNSCYLNILKTYVSWHSYFHRLPSLWNAIPILDLNMSVCLLKSKLKSYLWDHFLTNFDENNNCTLHYLCPCSRSHQTKPPTTNFNHL